MNESESIDNGDNIPSKSRQRLPLVLPSTSDSSPKLDQLPEKQQSQSQQEQQQQIISTSSSSDENNNNNNQTKNNILLLDSSNGYPLNNASSQKVSASQLTQLLNTAQSSSQFINDNNIHYLQQDVKYCKRHSLVYSPSFSFKQQSNKTPSSSSTNIIHAQSMPENNSNANNNADPFQLGLKKIKSEPKKIDSNPIQKKQFSSNPNQESHTAAAVSNSKNINIVQNMSKEQESGGAGGVGCCSENSSDDQSSGDSSDSSEGSSEEYLEECNRKQFGNIRSKNTSSDSCTSNSQQLSTSSSLQQHQQQLSQLSQQQQQQLLFSSLTPQQQSQFSQQHQPYQLSYQQQQYPLQFICVEMNCSETSKYCCVKCLSSGAHENHQAICFKTINSQIKSQLKLNKLSQAKQKIDSLFDNLQEKLQSCRETMNNQFNEAYQHLQEEAEYALNPTASLEKKVQIWKAYYQSEHAILMEHLNFILEKSESFFNQIGSRIINLNPKQLLHIKQHTKYDILFQKQIKNIQEELLQAEQNLSTRAKQALSALPQFNFSNDEFENSHAVAIKKVEYPERIEFCQVDKKGVQNGRCLIFWNDGAYRVGYHKGGQSQGVCRMVWENGNVYEGSYVDDRKQGQGFFIKYVDNTSYFGSFENDAKNGYGIEYYRNNTHYVGSFKNWKLHGKGQLIDTLTKKVLQEGYWKYNKYIGQNSDF